MSSTTDSKQRGTSGPGTFVFDGTNNFQRWRERVEYELLRLQLLGYVLVKGYNGSQTFTYQGDSVPAKTGGGLGQWEALQEANEAKSIVGGLLDDGVEAAIRNKNAYDSWALLNAQYGDGMDTSSYPDMCRALKRKFYDPNAGSVKDFVTEWEMMLRQLSWATGDHLSDALRSALLEDALPRSWRPNMATWRGSRPFTPYAELVKRAIAMGDCSNPREERGESRPRITSGTPAPTKQYDSAALCFYCLRPNHAFRACKYLADDIKTGKTHEGHSNYSCRVTDKRTLWMVQQLEAYIAERTRTADRPSMPRKRGPEIDLTQDEDDRRRRSQSQARPQRSRSVHSSTVNRNASRGRSAARSQSSFRGVGARQSRSRSQANSRFNFPQREPYFERVLGSS